MHAHYGYIYNGLATDHLLTTPQYEDLVPAEKEKHDIANILNGTQLAFEASKSLRIDTTGLEFLKSKESSDVQTSVINADGTIAYQSIRTKLESGNTDLTDREGNRIVATEYSGHSPTFRVINNEKYLIKSKSAWTSHSHSIILPDGRNFLWEYKKGNGFGEKGAKGTALMLSQDGKELAVLIRNEKTRPAGTSSRTAGGGGVLVLGNDALKEESIGEELVIASCLMVLKKEIDRSAKRNRLMTLAIPGN